MKTYLLLFFLMGALAVNAQTYSVSKTTNIFGDTIETYKDKNGKDAGAVKYSTDIFGNKIKTITGPNGEQLRSVKNSKDIFGNETTEFADEHGRTKATIKTSTDIFGKQLPIKTSTALIKMDRNYYLLKKLTILPLLIVERLFAFAPEAGLEPATL
jgi:hypothetical protein